MTHEIIEVCQDCGHVIDPQVVTTPDGKRYLITICQRNECIMDQGTASGIESMKPQLATPWSTGFSWYCTGGIIDPTTVRVTGF
jgi:hypothetical protein